MAVGLSGKPPLAEWTFQYDPSTLAVTKTVDPNLHETTAATTPTGCRWR